MLIFFLIQIEEQQAYLTHCCGNEQQVSLPGLLTQIFYLSELPYVPYMGCHLGIGAAYLHFWIIPSNEILKFSKLIS